MDASLDLDDLVRRSKDSTVTVAEITRVAHLLAGGGSSSNRYRLLYVLARSSARQYEGLVAGLLEDRDDPMVARLALQTLCTFWGLTARYTAEVHRFLQGVEWDYFGDVRQVAITAAGEFLRDNMHCDLLSDLLMLARAENEDATERRIAVEAVARALGEPLGETINANKGSMSWEAWASTIRERGQVRYASECR